MRPGDAPKGECPECREFWTVRDDGTLRRHPNLGNCPGSLRPPMEHYVHTCPCGATWDEHAEDHGSQEAGS